MTQDMQQLNLDDFERIDYAPAAPERAVFFLREYKPVIHVQYGYQDRSYKGLFYIEYPDIDVLETSSSEFLLEYRSNVPKVQLAAYRTMLRLDTEIATHLGYKSVSDARAAAHLHDILEWFDIREYLHTFSFLTLFGKERYDQYIMHPLFDHTIRGLSAINLQASRVLHQNVHTALSNTFTEADMATTPMAWMFSAVQEAVVAQTIDDVRALLEDFKTS